MKKKEIYIRTGNGWKTIRECLHHHREIDDLEQQNTKTTRHHNGDYKCRRFSEVYPYLSLYTTL